ncbi:MAG: hypothetical protein GY749_24875 [Desulfobacteraceae bacterium]|nr:hypothetical protein [Desulfobacteraceae bacterium]
MEKDKAEFPDYINSLLILFASVLERTGNTSPIHDIEGCLPESSVKYRLRALTKLHDINNIRTDYLNLFHPILELLKKAEYEEAEDYTRYIISFLITFYQKAIKKLSEKQFFKEVEQFKQLFSASENKAKYPFLDYPVFQHLLNGEKLSGDLEVSQSGSHLLHPSDYMFNVFKNFIIKPALNDPRTTFHNNILGYSVDTIRKDILKYGKCDFNESYNELTPDDIVLLYCYFNMRKHYFTSQFVFEKIYSSSNKHFGNPKLKPLFIDIGCGPLTSGLALGDIYCQKSNKKIDFNYIGIDNADSMLKKAKEFSQKCDISTSAKVLHHNLYSVP